MDERTISQLQGVELRDFLLTQGWDTVSNPHYEFQKEQFEKGNPSYPDKPSRLISIFESCPLTGVCYDEDCMATIRAFMLFPAQGYDLDDLMRGIGREIINLYNRELICWYSREVIEEDISANDYEFTATGQLFLGE